MARLEQREVENSFQGQNDTLAVSIQTNAASQEANMLVTYSVIETN